MGLHKLLQRTKTASPLVPALGYTVVLTLAYIGAGFAPDNPFVALAALLAWFAALILLFVIVTWYRDDDWLAAGFLFALTRLLGGIVASAIGQTVTTKSIAGAAFQAASASWAVFLRAIIAVPVSGAFVALARWLTRLILRKKVSESRTSLR